MPVLSLYQAAPVLLRTKLRIPCCSLLHLQSLQYSAPADSPDCVPEVLIPNRMAYAGALEPIDRNDIGAHGFVRGILDPSGCRISFVEHAEREYVHLDVPVDEKMTGYDLHTRIDELIGQRGVQNMYCLSLEGRRDPDEAFDLSQMDTFGNVLEIMDHTRPAYDYEKLLACG